MALFAVKSAIDDVTRVGQGSRELPIEIGIVLDNKKPQDLLRSAPADKRTLSRVDDYSRQTGQKFEFTVGTTGQLRAIIGSGFPADLVITSAPLMSELEKTGDVETVSTRIDSKGRQQPARKPAKPPNNEALREKQASAQRAPSGTPTASASTPGG